MTTLREPGPPRVIPWGNRLGESRELLSSLETEAPSSWRISTTWIEADCAFSHYPGKRRKIMLLRGGGFRLDFEGHAGARLSAPGSSADFLGAWITDCKLMAGRVEVLNLILGDTLPAPTLRWLAPGEGRIGARSKAIFGVAGQAKVRDAERTFTLEAGHLLAVAEVGDAQISVDADDITTRLLLIDIDDR